MEKVLLFKRPVLNMGGDLSRGKVDGDMVRCPFHQWGWGKTGVCENIPYADRIPEEARIQSGPVLAQKKLLFI